MPIMIVASLIIVIGFLPFPNEWLIKEFLSENSDAFFMIYQMTIAIITIYSTWIVGYSIAKSYKIDKVKCGLLSLVGLMMTMTPIRVADSSYTLPLSEIGGIGLFVGFIVAIISVEIYRFVHLKLNFKDKSKIPISVVHQIKIIIPTAMVILLIGSITYFLKFDWYGVIRNLMMPFILFSNSIIGIIFIIVLISVLWSFGVHGISIVGSFMRPIWIEILSLNIGAYILGESVNGIGVESFYHSFICIGGSGATIGLVINMVCFCKSKRLKECGRLSLVPSIFNINETVIFGVPVVLNKLLIIPFVITPVILGIISWSVISLGFVNSVVAITPWFIPSPMGAFLAAGCDIKAILLNIICILVSIIIYYPFIKFYDKRILKEEDNQS